jgi:hypothetical protein
LSHKDAGVKLFAVGKVMRILKSYTEGKTEINPLDRRLIKGFYTTDHWELENDQIADEATPKPDFSNDYLKQPVQADFKDFEEEPPSFSWNQMDENAKKNLLVRELNSNI